MRERLSHSFVVKVWLEETVEEAGRALWRGRIAHIPGGEERYVQDLNGIAQFIQEYLVRMGVRPAPPSRMQRLMDWVRHRGGTHAPRRPSTGGSDRGTVVP